MYLYYCCGTSDNAEMLGMHSGLRLSTACLHAALPQMLTLSPHLFFFFFRFPRRCKTTLCGNLPVSFTGISFIQSMMSRTFSSEELISIESKHRCSKFALV